jgi:hypothetical protein
MEASRGCRAVSVATPLFERYRSHSMTLPDALKRWNIVMAGFDLVLGSATLAAPRATLRALGHERPSTDAEHLFRRCGPIWLTFAAAHAVAATRGAEQDWWALAWLRGTEIATDAVWSASPALSRPGARAALRGAGVGNALMALGFARMALEARRS